LCGPAVRPLLLWLGGCGCFPVPPGRCCFCPACGSLCWRGRGRPWLCRVRAVWGAVVLGGFSSFGFSGSRGLSGAAAARCSGLAAAAAVAGCWVGAGCAPGADAAALFGAGLFGCGVRFAASSPRFAGLPRRSALAARSAWFVRSLAALPSPVLVSFPLSPCPAGLLPGRSWSVSGSGSWSSAALAVGLGVPVVLFLPAGCAPPAGWGFCAVSSGLFAGGWLAVPAAVQPGLF
jgi:hypothetical protein